MPPSITVPVGPAQTFIILDGDVAQASQHTEKFRRRGKNGVGVRKIGNFADSSTLITQNDVALGLVDEAFAAYKAMEGQVASSIVNSQGNEYTNVLIDNVVLDDAPAAEGIIGGNGTSGAWMRCRWTVTQL